MNGGIFEPPTGFVVSAIRHNKLIVLALAIVLAAIGAGVGAKHATTYTASTTLQVGQVNPNSPGFNGYTQSATALAAVFSRAIEAEAVLSTIQQKLKLEPAKAAKRLSSEPLPLAPAFRIVATGPTEPAAIQLANTASSAVIEDVSKTNSANPEASLLLKEYREASVQLEQILAKIENAEHTARTHGQARSELLSTKTMASAEAEKGAINARLRAIGSAYSAQIASEAPRSGLVTMLAGATSASGDHRSKIELYGLIGLLIGIVAGCAAAVVRERLRLRRRLTVMTETGTHRPNPA